MKSPLQQLAALGQSPWLDYISRELLEKLPHLIQAREVMGITSNPTIFEKAVSSGSDYDRKIEQMAQRGLSAHDIYQTLVVQDVARACDLLKGVYRATGARDGFVSLEVNPHLAGECMAQVGEADLLFRRVGRRNLLIKVPGTPRGLEATRRLIALGINVNITLLFSSGHYLGAARAYMKGLEDRLRQGQDLSRVASVASVFVSRIDTTVDRKLDEMGEEGRVLRGKAAVVNARLVYQTFRHTLASSRFKKLRNKGAGMQRLVWGSTSTKDPAYSDIKYVQELIGPDTINTIPLSTLEAFRDHGAARLTLEEGLEEARRDLEALSRLGIDLEEVGQELQDEGVKAFTRSHDNLIASIEAKRKAFLQGGFITGPPAG
ncbi:MAG: transaldolase [Chloroflexi bacterium]|nr:transaldolase [Chloroflexota bacterium]